MEIGRNLFHETYTVAGSGSRTFKVENEYLNRLLFMTGSKVTINKVTIEEISPDSQGVTIVPGLSADFFRSISDSDFGQIKTTGGNELFDIDVGSKDCDGDDYLRVTLEYTVTATPDNLTAYISVCGVVDEIEPEFLYIYNIYDDKERLVNAVDELYVQTQAPIDDLNGTNTDKVIIDSAGKSTPINLHDIIAATLMYNQIEGSTEVDGLEYFKMFDNKQDLPAQVKYRFLGTSKNVIAVTVKKKPERVKRSLIKQSDRRSMVIRQVQNVHPEIIESELIEEAFIEE